VSSHTKLMTGYAPPFDAVKTLHDVWESTCSRHSDLPCFGTRSIDADGVPGAYTWQTYGSVYEQRAAASSGFVHLGVRPEQNVGLYSINCAEWCVLESAMTRVSLVSVPLYDTLGPDAVRFICNHAELAAVCVSAACLPTMLGCLNDCPSVKLLVVYGKDPGGGAPAALPKTAGGCRIVTFEELIALGNRNPTAPRPPKNTDLATICYTSGTTGDPKGVMLTHLNLVSNAAAYADDLDLGVNDVHVSYLPLAHIYERVTILVCLFAGSKAGFFRGDVLGLLDDIAELKPTVFCSVPRLWNRIYDKVHAGIREGGFVKQKLFAIAFASKKKSLEEGTPPSKLWDKIVFSKLRDKLGGRVRYMSTGSAPISAEVMEFLRICFGGVVFEGYGMTESACVISKTHESDFSCGHVGSPVPCCEMKLESVPDMNYTTKDAPYPRGEVCVRGPSVFAGYYRAKDKTDEVVDADGWLHTGDIGLWLPGGRLKIIDRKKNIFKLAQGEYVAPEKIENIYARSKFVAQSFVHGDSLQPYLVAVVVPDEEVLIPWAKKNAHPHAGDFRRLCKDPVVLKTIFGSMKSVGADAGLKGFEQVRAIHLHDELFSVENGLFTPTFKLKRPQARDKFGREIERMYRELNAGR
jgi:long-chain acyl-CoA synthetase